MKFTKPRQSGFTLVEIAIVLVIIGLLLGGVLKGQQMIENSKMKSVVTDFRGITSAFNGYFDRYHATPGDESPATALARGWGALGGGNNDGQLAAAVGTTFTNAGAEQAAMWQVLRASGFLAGDPTLIGIAALPKAATGGLIGVATGPYALIGPSVCVQGLSHKQAAGIDTIIDGALPATNIGNNVGNARGAVGIATLIPAAPAPAPTAYNETLATFWTMCTPMQS
jgi:prepilin-type N-terminal cleavage/methylation domain-containing protein